ncbi:MAG: hypothetical protein K9G70_13265 [Prolixibacteraceae bacterium]|nr:hypothetical protein [Prolixibacteraceae bacterium]
MKWLAICIASLFMFTSCDEIEDLFGNENDDDQVEENDGVRLKKLMEYAEDGTTLIAQDEFIYTNEQLTEIESKEVNDMGVLDHIQSRVFNYVNDNKIEEERIWGGSVTTPFDYYLLDGKVTKIENKDLRNGSWLVEERWEYQYNGDLISEYLGSYDNDDGSTSYYGKADYFYINGRIQNIIHYMGGVNDWNIWYQDSVFSTTEERIDSILRYASSGGLTQKSYFYYNGSGLLEKVEGFNISQNVLQPAYTKRFWYNNENRIVEYEEMRNSSTKIYMLEWETGQGNEELLWKPIHQIEPGMPVFP